MSTITLPNIRVSSDLTVSLKLKDDGVAIDWSTLSNVKVSIYSDAQRALAGRCTVSIDEDDPTLLVCTYAANKPQYVGVNRVVVCAKYMGETKTYDKPAFNFVRWTDDQAGQTITIDDPDIDVEISVEDISSSILQEAVDAAFTAADRANDAAAAAEHMVDIHTGPQGEDGKSAYQCAVDEGYIGTEEEWLASLNGTDGADGDPAGFGTVSASVGANTGTPSVTVTTSGPDTAKNITFAFDNLKGATGETGATPAFSIGTVTTGAAGSQAAATITGTAAAPVLNLTIPQGDQGNTGSSVEYAYELVNNLTTNDATKGLSAAQGVVLDGKVTQLEAKVDEMEIGRLPVSYTTNSGYISPEGTPSSSTHYDYTSPISVKQGQKMFVNTAGYSFAAISKYNSGTYTPVVVITSGYLNIPKEVSYEATEDCSLVACYKNDGNSYGIALSWEIGDKVLRLDEDVDEILGSFTEETQVSPNLFDKTAAVSGKGIWRADGAADTRSDSYASDFIPIPADATYMTLVGLAVSGGFGAAIYNSSRQWRSGVSSATFAVNPASGDAYFRFTINATDINTAMAVVGQTAPSEYIPYGTETFLKIIPDAIPDGAITGEKLADGSVTGDKLDADAINEGISNPVQKYVGFNLLNPATSQNGYINKNTGDFVASNADLHLFATDFIPVNADVYAYPATTYGSAGGSAVYDSNKQYLRSTGAAYTYQDGDAFVRFTYKDNNGYQVICNYPAPTITGVFSAPYVEQNITSFSGGQVFGADNIPVAKPAIASIGQDGMQITIPSLSGNYSELTGWPSYIKNGQTISVRAKITTAGEIRCGFGREQINGFFVKVDATKVYLCRYVTGDSQVVTSQDHDLTLADFVDVLFTMRPDKYKVCVTTSDGAFVLSGDFETKRENYGIPFVEAVGATALADVSVRAVSDRFRKPVWVVGDSYVSLYQQRWPYQLLFSFGYDAFLLDGLAGGTSEGMFAELGKLLSLGCPKYLVWCLGMNDESWKWRQIEKQVEMLCRARGIQLILTTIPWPTGGNKADINQCVKDSGYRYIDVYDAVSSDANGTWYAGMNDDGTHPTTLGAKAIAGRVLADFPEITQ